ncbi:hypothetical protein [Flavobacterium sp.]|uniref:hypothetical protein n=1 Tax=Flavobacterium sp. TaxID=239 RepID=UPI0026227FEF|nr:hypothetical protein [Flavobacterium sp.]
MIVKIKDIIGGIFIVIFISYFTFLFYDSTKRIYEDEVQDTIIDKKSNSKLGHEFLLSREKIYTSFFSDDSDQIKIGDSIFKNSNSTEYKIYRKDSDSNTRIYCKSIFIKKDLLFYDFIVKED